MKLSKAFGQRGSWFATVDGDRLPCVHQYWVKGLLHHDRFRRHDGRDGEGEKIRELVDAIQAGKRVVLTSDEPQLDAAGEVRGFKRTGYIAVYRVEDVTYSASEGLRFRLAERLKDLA